MVVAHIALPIPRAGSAHTSAAGTRFCMAVGHMTAVTRGCSNGRRRRLGFVSFALLDSRSLVLTVVAITVGLLFHGAVYGPQAAFLSVGVTPAHGLPMTSVMGRPWRCREKS